VFELKRNLPENMIVKERLQLFVIICRMKDQIVIIGIMDGIGKNTVGRPHRE